MLDEQQSRRADIKDVRRDKTSSCDDKEQDSPQRSGRNTRSLASLCMAPVDHLEDRNCEEDTIDNDDSVCESGW